MLAETAWPGSAGWRRKIGVTEANMEKEKEGKRKGADKKLNKQHWANKSDWELTFSSLLGLFEAPL